MITKRTFIDAIWNGIPLAIRFDDACRDLGIKWKPLKTKLIDTPCTIRIKCKAIEKDGNNDLRITKFLFDRNIITIIQEDGGLCIADKDDIKYMEW